MANEELSVEELDRWGLEAIEDAEEYLSKNDPSYEDGNLEACVEYIESQGNLTDQQTEWLDRFVNGAA